MPCAMYNMGQRGVLPTPEELDRDADKMAEMFPDNPKLSESMRRSAEALRKYNRFMDQRN